MSDKFSMQKSHSTRDIEVIQPEVMIPAKQEPNTSQTKYGTFKLSEKNISDGINTIGKGVVAAADVANTIVKAQARIAEIKELSEAKIKELDKEIEKIIQNADSQIKILKAGNDSLDAKAEFIKKIIVQLDEHQNYSDELKQKIIDLAIAEISQK